jgi:hypothetical protein
VALFNGVYGVVVVKHSIGVGGWETSFEATLNYFPEEFRAALKAQQTAKEESAAQDSSKAQVQTKHEQIKPINDLLFGSADVPVQPIDLSADLKKFR